MRIRSMNNPVAAYCWPLSLLRARAPIAAKVGSGGASTFRLLRSCDRMGGFLLARLVVRAAARLCLAPFEIFPQRRTQPRLARRLRPSLGALGHGRSLGRDLRPVHASWPGFVPAIHVFDAITNSRRGCPAQGRA